MEAAVLVPINPSDSVNPVSDGDAFKNSLNDSLYASLIGAVLSPQGGIQKIRNIMLDHGIDIPMVFDLDPAGSELIFTISDDLFLYIVYALDVDGYYEFFAAVVDADELDELTLNYEDDEDGNDTE